METASKLTTNDAEMIERLATEYRTLCESAWKFNDGKFLSISKTKLGHIKKFLGNLCEKDGTVSESSEEKSFLSKIDCRKIMNLVMDFGWNCWNLGDQMFPWEDAENDDSRDKLESFLSVLTGEPDLKVSEETEKDTKVMFIEVLERLIKKYGDRCYICQFEDIDASEQGLDENQIYEEDIKLKETVMAASPDNKKCDELKDKILDYGGQMASYGISVSGSLWDREDLNVCKQEANDKFAEAIRFANEIFEQNQI